MGNKVRIETKTVPIGTVKLNPDNPRRIGNAEMDRLIKSLQEFPDMLSIREIVCDETMTVLGGNMRLLALRKIGVMEVAAKIVHGLTSEQKREFIVKDNGQWGEWDFDVLANAWGDLPLVDWGVEVPASWAPPGEVIEDESEQKSSIQQNECPKCGYKWTENGKV
jgi:hypothetical protein